MNQSKLKTLSFAIGGCTLLFAGLFYVLVTDLSLLNSAEWLFFAIITAFGGGFCSLLSESIKNKHVWFYIVKGLGIVCSALFIFIIFRYCATVDFLSIAKTKGLKTADIQSTVSLVKIVCLIFSFVGILCQAFNVALNIIYKIDD